MIPDKYLKCTLSKKEKILQRMRLDIFKMFYTNICIFFLAAELKKRSFFSRENTSLVKQAPAICKPKFKKTKYLDSVYFQMGYAMYPF